jgi:Flp pilus assembly protein TadD
MDHDDFLSQSAAVKADAVRRKYEGLCDAILHFLNGHLKGDREALQRMQTSGAGGVVEVAYQAPMAAPPTGAQVAKLYCAEGEANLEALAPLVKDTYWVLAVEAAGFLQEDGRKLEAASLLRWAAPQSPKAADLQRALGQALAGLGDKAGARKAFEKALELLAEDGTLDAMQKMNTRKAVEAGLKALLK